MKLHVVLDACVLLPMPLADTLLQLAEAGYYIPVWSAELLDEIRRNLIIKWGLSEERADRRIRVMRQAWVPARGPGRHLGQVPGTAYRRVRYIRYVRHAKAAGT